MKRILYSLFFVLISTNICAEVEDFKGDTTYVSKDWYNVSFDDWVSSNKQDGIVEDNVIEFYAISGDKLSFEWFTSCELNCDKLVITLDGTTILSKSGINENDVCNINITTDGMHTLTMYYAKDHFGSEGEDVVSVSNIELKRMYTTERIIKMSNKVADYSIYTSDRPIELNLNNANGDVLSITNTRNESSYLSWGVYINNIERLRYSHSSYEDPYNAWKPTTYKTVGPLDCIAGEDITWPWSTILDTPNTYVYISTGATSGYSYAHSYFNLQLTRIYDIVNKECIIDASNKAYSINIPSKVEELSFIQTFSDRNWQSLYLPFEMQYDDWRDHFDIAKIDNIYSYDDDDDDIIDRIELKASVLRDGKSVKPNTAYLIKAKNADNNKIIIHDANLHQSTETSQNVTMISNIFRINGTYHTINNITGTGCFAVSDGKLKLVESQDDSIKPFHWYIEITNSDNTPAKFSNTVFDIIVTDSLATETKCIENNELDNRIFTIDGKGLDNNRIPLKKGIYIFNNKKIVVK